MGGALALRQSQRVFTFAAARSRAAEPPHGPRAAPRLRARADGPRGVRNRRPPLSRHE